MALIGRKEKKRGIICLLTHLRDSKLLYPSPSVQTLCFEFEFFTFNSQHSLCRKTFSATLFVLQNCKYVKDWSFMSNLPQAQRMIEARLRVLTSLSLFLFITSFLWIFGLCLRLWCRIEFVELKKFLHVMVKNFLRLKKRKRKKEKGKTHSGRKLHFGRNCLELVGMPSTSRNLI